MAAYSHVPKALFDADLDAIVLAHVKKLIPDPTGELARRFYQLPATLSDAFMMAPRLTFKIYGENSHLALMVQIFGLSTVEELLREGALEFILWRENIMTVQTPIDGLIPFAPGSLNNPENSDPEASNATGLLSASSLTDAQRKRLAALATEHTSVTNPEGAKRTWEFMVEAHKRGQLSQYGLPAEIPLSKATEEQKVVLGRQLQGMHQASELVDRELDLHEGSDTWDAVRQLAREVNSSPQVVLTADEVLKEDRAPSVGRLVSRKILQPRDVIKLRQTSEARAFREWLWTQPDPADDEGVLREYRRVIAGDRKNLKNKGWYRTLRVVSVGIVGSAAGTAIGGGIIGSAAGIGVALVDDFLQRIKAGRSPRRLSRMLGVLEDGKR